MSEHECDVMAARCGGISLPRSRRKPRLSSPRRNSLVKHGCSETYSRRSMRARAERCIRDTMIDPSRSPLAMDQIALLAAPSRSFHRAHPQELCFLRRSFPIRSLSLSLPSLASPIRRRNIPRNIGRARVTGAVPECSSRANGALARLTSLPVFENVDRAGMRTEMRHPQTRSQRARCELEFMTTNSSVTRSAGFEPSARSGFDRGAGEGATFPLKLRVSRAANRISPCSPVPLRAG